MLPRLEAEQIHPPRRQTGAKPPTAQDCKRDTILLSAPALRAFAVSLCGNADRADDLVQETFVRAIVNIESFEPGTNITAWLITILRNLFFSQYRKQRLDLNYRQNHVSEPRKIHPEQYGKLELQELYGALLKLPKDQRDALMLVGASGFTCDEAAAACGCAVGTVKSRVHRARTRLAKFVRLEETSSFGPNASELAVLN